jgi:hypothetical protein
MTIVRTETRSGPGAATAAQVSPTRLHVLRAGYLVLGVGLAVTRWPLFLRPDWPLTEGIVHCMLAAMSVLCLLGVRYPLQMLPVLLFEVAWKLLWLAVVALPLWATDQVDQATRSTTYDLLWVVVPLVVVPWRHVYLQYVRRPVDPWRTGPSSPAGSSD